MDHFDEWRYAVQGQLFQDLSRETLVPSATTSSRPRCRCANSARSCPATRSAAPWSTGTASSGASCRYFFEYRTHLEQRYGKSFLPADTTIQDWGITYDELEPYYTQFDKMFGIAGKAGNMQGRDQAWRQPVRGAALEEYPQPPNKIAYGADALPRGCEELGLQAVPHPTANSPGAYTNPDGDAARRLQLLRLLRALRLPRRRQGQPDRDHHPERAGERPSSKLREYAQRLPHQPTRTASRDQRLLLRRDGPGAGATRRPRSSSAPSR